MQEEREGIRLEGLFEDFVIAEMSGLLRFALAMTRERASAEDLVQTSLMRAMRAWRHIADEERWRQRSYVRKIILNTHRSNWRAWGSRVSASAPPERVADEQEDGFENREVLRAALAKLPSRQRSVLVLRYWKGFSELEIADTLHCAPGTVKSSSSRALNALADQLTEVFRFSAPEEQADSRGEDLESRLMACPIP